MKNLKKDIRKVSNPEIPVEAFYALGGIAILAIGFFVWRATRNISGIRQEFSQAFSIANEEGGDYAEKAASAIRQTPQLNQERFVSDFNIGTPTTTTPTTTTPTTTTPTTTTPTTTTPTTTTTTTSTQTTAVDPRPPVVPSGEITESQRNAILALAPNIQNLRTPRNSYERMLSDRDVADVQGYLIRAFNAGNNQNINARAFADGNIGRMTRALIFWVRTHPIYRGLFLAENQLPVSDENSVFLYDGFFSKLERFTREMETGRYSSGSSSGQSGLFPRTQSVNQETFYTPGQSPRTPVNQETFSSGSISIKSKKRKL